MTSTEGSSRTEQATTSREPDVTETLYDLPANEPSIPTWQHTDGAGQLSDQDTAEPNIFRGLE